MNSDLLTPAEKNRCRELVRLMIRQNQLLSEILKTKNSNSWVQFETKTKRKENNEKKKEMKINRNYPTLPYFYMMTTLKNFFGNH